MMRRSTRVGTLEQRAPHMPPPEGEPGEAFERKLRHLARFRTSTGCPTEPRRRSYGHLLAVVLYAGEDATEEEMRAFDERTERLVSEGDDFALSVVAAVAEAEGGTQMNADNGG